MIHDQKHDQRGRRRNCADKIRMRLARAYHARQELSAQGAALQLYSIFVILLGSALRLPSSSVVSRPADHSDQTDASGNPEPSYRPAPTLDRAMRDIRSARFMTPRVERAIAALKKHAPEASDWIDDRAYWLEWSDIAKSAMGGNDQEKRVRLAAAATAWRMQKAEAAKTFTNGTTFKR